MKFETNTCPLCGNVLRLRMIAGVSVFTCPNASEYMGPSGLASRSHYEVEYDKMTCVQHIYIGEWGIDNFSNTNKSRLYKLDERFKWKFVADLPLVRADTEEKILKRLNQVMHQ